MWIHLEHFSLLGFFSFFHCTSVTLRGSARLSTGEVFLTLQCCQRVQSTCCDALVELNTGAVVTFDFRLI